MRSRRNFALWRNLCWGRNAAARAFAAWTAIDGVGDLDCDAYGGVGCYFLCG